MASPRCKNTHVANAWCRWSLYQLQRSPNLDALKNGIGSVTHSDASRTAGIHLRASRAGEPGAAVRPLNSSKRRPIAAGTEYRIELVGAEECPDRPPVSRFKARRRRA